MPDYFSHIIAAEKIYERLDGETKNKIKSKYLYLLGSQGPDIFFTYNFKLSSSNLGRVLHSQNVRELFEKLMGGNPSYCAGFATHYALDSTLHPAVYAYENAHRTPLTHQRFEGDLGLFVSRYYGVRRRILPKERVLACTGAVYDSVRRACPPITITGVERCLKRHFAYTRYIYRTKRQSFKCDFDFSSLSGALKEAEELGAEAVKCVLSGNIDGAIFSKRFLEGN